jgi:HAD superfamily hydrolase (TIGR01662 family)
MLDAVIFDFGHTIMDELQYREIPLRFRPVRLMPGVEETLPKIPLKLGIWANTKRAREAGVRRWLRRAGIDTYFTWVVTSVEAGYRKPDSRFFDYALRRCGLKKNEVLFVGNQLDTDMKGASDYGIANVWLSDAEFRSPDDQGSLGKRKPAHTIACLEELPDLVRNLRRKKPR